jgi:hypothetical protein
MTRHQPRDKVRATRPASILRRSALSSQVFHSGGYHGTRAGAVAERLGRGLQSPVQRFESAPRLYPRNCRPFSSSAAETHRPSASIRAMRSATSSIRAWTYKSAVGLTDEWPSKIWISSMASPRRRHLVANACRAVCGHDPQRSRRRRRAGALSGAYVRVCLEIAAQFRVGAQSARVRAAGLMG